MKKPPAETWTHHYQLDGKTYDVWENSQNEFYSTPKGVSPTVKILGRVYGYEKKKGK